jgi:hypothetical protein
MPEGVQSVADRSAQRQRMSAFRGRPHTAHDLSMLVDLDEPDLFVREALQAIKPSEHDPKWAIVAEALESAQKQLEVVNEPSR